MINDGIVEIGAVENRPNWDHDRTEQMRANNQNEMDRIELNRKET